jgi:L-fuculose-phosphate aldolase
VSRRTLQGEREDLVAYGRRMAADRLAIGTGGNLSCRVGDVVAITPRGVGYDVMEPDHICLVTMSGVPIDARLEPSSELPMHLSVYERTDAAAVVHAHSEYATTLGTLIDELPPIHYLISLLGGPVRVVPYATPGSAELADHMAKGLEGRTGVLLGNHGTITTGSTLDQAYSRAVLLEWLCGLYYRARLFGEPRLLDMVEIDKVARQLEHYLQDPGS